VSGGPRPVRRDWLIHLIGMHCYKTFFSPCHIVKITRISNCLLAFQIKDISLAVNNNRILNIIMKVKKVLMIMIARWDSIILDRLHNYDIFSKTVLSFVNICFFEKILVVVQTLKQFCMPTHT